MPTTTDFNAAFPAAMNLVLEAYQGRVPPGTHALADHAIEVMRAELDPAQYAMARAWVASYFRNHDRVPDDWVTRMIKHARSATALLRGQWPATSQPKTAALRAVA